MDERDGWGFWTPMDGMGSIGDWVRNGSRGSMAGVDARKRNAVLSVPGVGAALGALCYNFAVTSKLEVSM